MIGKQIVNAIGIVILFCGLTTAAPVLSINGDKYSFGTVPQNVTVAQYFWFKSTGTDTLRISEIKTGCHCATMTVNQTSIPPNDSMLVGLHWDIEHGIGGIGKYPYIFTNARTEPYRIFLTAEATNAPDSNFPVAAKPYAWSLTKTATTAIDSIEFHLINKSDKDIKLVLASHLPEQVVFQLPTEIKAKSEASGYVRIRPEFADKEFAESITLMCDDTRDSRFTIPITRKIYSTTGTTK